MGNFAETAQMLDTCRSGDRGEGSHEVHDLFEQAHIALGEAYLKDNRPADALRSSIAPSSIPREPGDWQT
jgi:hypothetical protein